MPFPIAPGVVFARLFGIWAGRNDHLNAPGAEFSHNILRAIAAIRDQVVKFQVNGQIMRLDDVVALSWCEIQPQQLAQPYPLNGITYCCHCEQLAAQHNNPKLRSQLGGKDRVRNGRYRHRPSVRYGSTNRLVKYEIYERDFARLLKLITVDTSQVDLMVELGVQSVKAQAAEDIGTFVSPNGTRTRVFTLKG